MSDIYSILNQTKKESPQRLPKEEFIEKIKQQKNSTSSHQTLSSALSF